jgi:hypothetical protein
LLVTLIARFGNVNPALRHRPEAMDQLFEEHWERGKGAQRDAMYRWLEMVCIFGYTRPVAQVRLIMNDRYICPCKTRLFA